MTTNATAQSACPETRPVEAAAAWFDALQAMAASSPSGVAALLIWRARQGAGAMLSDS